MDASFSHRQVLVALRYSLRERPMEVLQRTLFISRLEQHWRNAQLSLPLLGHLSCQNERDLPVHVLAIGRLNLWRVAAPAEPSRRKVSEQVGQAADRRQVWWLVCADLGGHQRPVLHRGQLLVVLQALQVAQRLLPNVVLLHDLHLGELVLVDQSLGEHLVRDQGQRAVLTAVEDLDVEALVLMEHLLLAESDCTRVLCILTLVESDLERAFPVETATVDVGDRLKSLH